MNIRAYLSKGRPLLFDGAMGTYYASLPGRMDFRCELASLEYPEEVTGIHQAYLEGGCQAIKTNTFSVGNDLAEGREELAVRLIQASCRLAQQAAQRYDAWVFADMGPIPAGKELSPGETYCRQAELFLQQGITHFLVETLPTDEGIPELAQYLKERCPSAFLMVSFAVGFDGFTREGQSGQILFCRTAALDMVDCVGFNCVSGPHHLLKYIQGLDRGDALLSVMPNAGYPSVLGRRVSFQGSPDYFAQQMSQIVQAGAAIVGGCCGTTPEHMARTAKALKGAVLQIDAAKAKGVGTAQPLPKVNPLWERLESGQRVIAVELDPPVNDNVDIFLEGVHTLHRAGADAVTIADCPIGRPRADSSLLACKLKRELGVEPLPHMTCRDRNLNAIKALLLGLSMEDVHNVLLVTGDPIPTEARDEVKSVFNFNARKLARYVSGLNEHTLTTPFRMFAALNLNAANFAVQLRLAQEKEQNGVSGFLTQPIHSREALDNLKLAREVLKGKILGGIFPIVSYRNACFLNNEIAGMRVCDEIVRLYKDRNRDEAEELAVTISTAIAQEITPHTDGLYLMTPFHRVELMGKIIRSLR